MDVQVSTLCYIPKRNIKYYVAYAGAAIINDIQRKKDAGLVIDCTRGKKILSVVYLQSGEAVLVNTKLSTLHTRMEEAEKKSRVPAHDIHNYAAGSRNKVYGWEITAVKEYPQAVALEELGMKRAPQSWQYVR